MLTRKRRARVALSTALAALAAVGACASQAFAEAPTSLPLKRVRLYEVGVGYFERTGVLRDKADLGLSLPRNQLDDALSTLVVLGGKGDARVADIEFESHESPGLARAEAALSDDPDAPLEFGSVLRSFRGALVEVRTRGKRLRGRLIDVIALDKASAERCLSPIAPTAGAPATACSDARDANLVVLDADGTLSRSALAEVESVRALEPSVAARLTRALSAVTERKAAPARRILHVHGSGSAALSLGYIAEAPVWRASYRLLLEDDGKSARIQGFALVHNDSDEAWRHVALELVNGRPSSFLYPLAAPRYARRALVTPDEPLSTVPQLLGQSPDELWGDEAGESYGAGGIGLSGVGEGGGGRGEGIGIGSVGTVGHGAGTSDLLDVGHLADLSGATGVEGAAQFSYRVAQPIELGAHASALVPFVSEALTLSRVTWFEQDDAGETAIELLNSSPQTLPAGVISIYAEGGFSGSSLLPRTKPGETRVLRFGRDLDVALERHVLAKSSEPKLYSYVDGQLAEHALRQTRLRFDLHNQSKSARTVSVALDVRRNASITGADEAAYDAELAHGVVSFRVAAHSDSQRELQVTEGLRTPIDEAHVTAQFLQQAARQASLTAAQRAILSRAAHELYLSEIRSGALPKRKAELDEALGDTARLESHVRALGASSNEGRLAAERLRQSEDRVQSLRNRIADLSIEIPVYEERARGILRELGAPNAASAGSALHVE